MQTRWLNFGIGLLVMMLGFVTSVNAASDQYVNYLKSVENGTKEGYKGGKWYVHTVLGVPHIGYGHKLGKGEKYPDGLSDEQVEALLMKDIEGAAIQCSKEIPNWAKLSTHQQEMLMDFAFNLGTTTTFPKFVLAVVNNDKPSMEKEYKRYVIINGERIELKSRNKAYHSLFME